MFALSHFSVNQNRADSSMLNLATIPSASSELTMPLAQRTVAIVVDSAASLPPGFSQQRGIFIAPMTVTLDGYSYRDGIDITTNEFYRRLRTASTSPTTSAPSTAAYMEAFHLASKEHEAILCVSAGERFSASFDAAALAAVEARHLLPSTEIRLLDSQAAAGSQALATLEAWRAAQEGATLARAEMLATRVVDRVSLLAFVDTLRYLRRSGRVPLVAHLGASLLRIKPLFKLEKSEITTMARLRTRRAGIRRMLGLMRDKVSTDKVHAAVMHADAPEDAESIRRSIETDFDCAELYISEFTPAMGAHIGPGLLGIAFWSESA